MRTLFTTRKLIAVLALACALLTVAIHAAPAGAHQTRNPDDWMGATQYVQNNTPYTMHVIKQDLNGAQLFDNVHDIPAGQTARITVGAKYSAGIHVSFGYQLFNAQGESMGVVDTYVEVTCWAFPPQWSADNSARVYGGKLKTRWDNDGATPYQSNLGFGSHAYFDLG